MSMKESRKRVFKRISIAFGNISLKNKVILINSVVLIFIFIGMTVSFGMIIQNYNSNLYKSTLDNLNLSTAGIDQRLKSLENVSGYIIADDILQNGLGILKDSNEGVAGRKSVTQITERIYRYLSYHRGIASITIVDHAGKVMRSSQKNILTEEVIAKGCKTAERYAGKGVWLIDDIDQASIIYARQILRIENLELDHLGTVLIQVRLNRIVDEELKKILYDKDLQSGKVYILHQNKIVYPIGEADVEVLDTVKESSKQGYNILKLNGQTFFATYNKLNELDLEYALFTPYDKIYKAIHRINRMIYLLNFILFALAMLLTIWLVTQVTRQFKHLVFQMRRFEENQFKNKMQYNAVYMERKDEVGFLFNTFYHMADNIDKLINENLKKQILIKDTQLKSLVSQINPHFLYNTLNSINWIAKLNQQKQISEMVEALANLMRISMDTKATMIPLGKELEIIEDYILIQKVRYGEKLVFEKQAEGKVLESFVPKLCIQPLVENSIRHVLEKTTETCKIKMTLLCEENWFEVQVWDNGQGIDEDILTKLQEGVVKPQNTGIGLANIQDRVKLIYGHDYGLSFRNQNNGTLVSLRLPFEREGKENV